MKLYEVTTVELNHDKNDIRGEYQYYFGPDFEAAKQAKADLITSNENHLTPREKEVQFVEARIYEISDDVDWSDDEAVIDAICECGGYDTF